MLLTDAESCGSVDSGSRVLLRIKHGFSAAFRNSQSGAIELCLEFSLGVSELHVKKVEGLTTTMLIISSANLIVTQDV